MFERVHRPDCGHRAGRDDGSPVGGTPTPRRRRAVGFETVRGRRLGPSLVATVSAVAFWTAVAVPFLYVPLVLDGLSTQGELLAFGLLLAVNVVALWLGHGYRHARTEGETESAAGQNPLNLSRR